MNFIFTNIDEEVKKKYLKEVNIITKTYFRNQLIISQHSVCDHIGFINSGSIILKKVFHDNHETLLKYIGKNDTFGHDIIFYYKNIYPYSIYSISHTNISFISYKDLTYLMSCSTTISLNLLKLMSSNLIRLDNEIKILRHQSILSRVCEFLHQEYLKTGIKTFSISLNKTDLAFYLGSTRTLLSKEIKFLTDNNIISNVGYVYSIIDLKKLGTFMCD